MMNVQWKQRSQTRNCSCGSVVSIYEFDLFFQCQWRVQRIFGQLINKTKKKKKEENRLTEKTTIDKQQLFQCEGKYSVLTITLNMYVSNRNSTLPYTIHVMLYESYFMPYMCLCIFVSLIDTFVLHRICTMIIKIVF